MSGIKDLGRVKGEKGDKGDTYIPEVTQENDSVKLTWTVDNEVKYETSIKMPYYVPVQDGDEIRFIQTQGTYSGDIASFKLKDLKGKDGAINVEPLNSLPDDDDARADTLYVIGESVFVYDEDGAINKKWIELKNPIDLSNYLTISNAETRFTSIETRIGQILEQQYIISELLGDITIIDD